MKRCVIGIAFFYFALYCLGVETNPKKLEARLAQSTGKERIEILVKLTKVYRSKEPKKAFEFGHEALKYILEARNHLNRALVYFTDSLGIKDEIKEADGIVEALVRIGAIKRKLGQYREAIPALNRALELSIKINARAYIRDAYNELSQIFAAKKDYPNAFKYHKKYKEANDAIFNKENSKRIAEMQARFDMESRKKEISLLQKTQELKQMELTRQKNLKKSFFIVSLLVVILAFVIFTRYRLKIKVTRQLNKEIQEHKQTAAELLKSQKLESIGILAGGIAHDFNNLLTIIIGNISMAVEEIEGDARNARVVKMLKSAEKSSHEATDLAQKLITFSMGGWIIPQKVALTTILKSVLEYYPQMEPLLKNTSITPGLKSLYSDERQLRQVMYNLLQNANEAMTDPMKVTIKAENITINENNNFSLEPGDYVKISVIDNGRGIPSDKLEKIFDPYFTTKGTVTQKGLGLGLAICYSITRKHNGHIAVKSKVGKGTTVELYLPTYSETVNDNT